MGTLYIDFDAKNPDRRSISTTTTSSMLHGKS
jgi:hypothetical protein